MFVNVVEKTVKLVILQMIALNVSPTPIMLEMEIVEDAKELAELVNLVTLLNVFLADEDSFLMELNVKNYVRSFVLIVILKIQQCA